MRVLAVDNDSALLTEIQSYLGRSPQLFTVRVTNNGHVAARALQEFQPHVALLNPAMPAPAGLALCRRINAAVQANRTRVIALVQRSDQQVISSAREYGIALCLNRAASLETIRYEIWRLAEELQKLESRATRSSRSSNYMATRAASHHATPPRAQTE